MNKYFYEIFETLPRLGPGNNECTEKAFRMITQQKNAPQNPNILDIGCGTGLHTIHLAKQSDGKIIAVDRHQPFLDTMKQNVRQANLEHKIECRNGDMTALDFPEESFDIIWAEGAIFIMGLDKGLKEWKKFLKPGGFIALTDLFWFKEKPPKELETFFTEDCGGVMSGDAARRVIAESGYRRIDDFILPESCWLDFYRSIEEQLIEFREKYEGNSEAQDMADYFQKEIDLYGKYSQYYGYIFFIMRKEG